MKPSDYIEKNLVIKIREEIERKKGFFEETDPPINVASMKVDLIIEYLDELYKRGKL